MDDDELGDDAVAMLKYNGDKILMQYWSFKALFSTIRDIMESKCLCTDSFSLVGT